MNIGFDNINDHVIPMDDFSMKWRFTEEKYDKLPEIHLNQLRPLNAEGSKFLWDYISAVRLHENIPFKKGLFSRISEFEILIGNEKDVKKWLYQRGIAFGKEVYLSWQQDTAMIVPWKLLIKYFDAFYYPISDDLTVIDQSLDWALLFFHTDQIYFGTNKTFKTSGLHDDIDFLW